MTDGESAADRMRATITPLYAEAHREQEANGRIGTMATEHIERTISGAFEDALVKLLVDRGVMTQREWEERFIKELTEKVARVLQAVRENREAIRRQQSRPASGGMGIG